MIAIKYIVRFNYIDGDGILNKCHRYFETNEEAKEFYNQITKTTEELIEQYGRYGVYNPYTGIELSKEVIYD